MLARPGGSPSHGVLCPARCCCPPCYGNACAALSGLVRRTLAAVHARVLALYSLWIAVAALAFALALVGEQPLPRTAHSLPRRLLDGALTLVAALIVARGGIALALPLSTDAEPD